MLYENTRGYLPANDIMVQRGINDIVSMECKTFIDVVRLYIKLWGMLSVIWDTHTDTPKRRLDDNLQPIVTEHIFDKNKFNYLFLVKWSLLNNENILHVVLRDAMVLLEGYLEQFIVIDKPRWDLFIEFSKNNFSKIGEVFINDFNTEYLFTYMKNGEQIKVENKTQYVKINKEDMLLIMDQYDLPESVRDYLIDMRDLNFSSFRKYALEAVEMVYRDINPQENVEFMTNLWNEFNRLKDNTERK